MWWLNGRCDQEVSEEILMRVIRNDKKAYKTRESLSSPPRTKDFETKPKDRFEFEISGHYVTRRIKAD
jgi:hypothetical protein